MKKMKSKEKAIPGFKAVEFMRKARKEATEQYQKDPKAYLKHLEEISKEFLQRRKAKSQTAL